MTRILAFDPGSTRSGWCLVVSNDARPVVVDFVAAGEVDSTSPEVCALLGELQPGVVAVEVLRGIAYPAKGAGIVGNLASASFAAGLIAGLATPVCDEAVVEMTAREWRGSVLGKPNASDQAIAVVVPRLVRGWPKRSNVHERDAGGLALAVAWRRASMSRAALRLVGTDDGAPF